jgi:hypothetical protein
MKNIKKYSIILVLGLMVTACKTEIVDVIDLNSLENGGYIRTVTPFPVVSTTFNYSLANLSAAKMEFLAEAVTPNKGASFASYDLAVKFVDVTPANGTKTGTSQVLKSVASSAFAKDATTGYPRATITVTGSEALAASKVALSDMSQGDRFEITGTMKLTNGKSFTVTNTGLNVTGGAFYSAPFFYRVNLN